LELAGEIAEKVDEEKLQITRPLQVYRDFADVSLHAPPSDGRKVKKALANFCTLLYRELRRILDVADKHHSQMYVQMEILLTSARAALESSDRTLGIKNQLQDCQGSEVLALAASAQTEILDICDRSCDAEENCINAFRVLKRLSGAGWVEMAHRITQGTQ